MGSPARKISACVTVLALLFWVAPLPVLAGDSARLEGLIIQIDGRPAAGYQVHLIDDKGTALDSSRTTDDGLYSFTDLASGQYSLGIEEPRGAVAPVAGPPVKVADHQLVRRDVKLMQADPSAVDRTLGANYGLGSWWNSTSAAGKAWTIIGIIIAGALIYDALDDDDDDEPEATPAF